MLYLLLAAAIVLLPNALHIPFGTGIPGLNFSNLLFLMLVVGVAFTRERAPVSTGRWSQLTAPLLLFFGVLIVGYMIAAPTELSDHLTDVTRLKNAIFYPLFYFVFRHCKQDLGRTRRLILLVLLVAPIAALEAVSQGIQFGLGEYVETQRATGPFGDANMANRAGVFFAMFLPMAAAIAVFDQRKAIRVVAVVACILLAGAILFTYSRQSYLIGLLGLLILLMHRSMVATVLAGILLVGTVSYLPTSVIQRVEQTRKVDATGGETVDNSTASRFEIWQGAARMWRDHPEGVGLGRFTTYIGRYSTYQGMDAHNGFVLVWAELGLPGILAMLWLFWRMWVVAKLARRVSPPEESRSYALALGFKITVFSVALSNMYGSPFFEGLIMANFWILCGLMERFAVLRAATAPAAVAASDPAVMPLARMADRFPLVARTLPGLGAGARSPQA